jgi:uncharacterized protein (TIGR02118 family)
VYTVIFELYRKEGVSQEEFVSHWHEVHKPIAMQIPLVRSYKICPVTEAVGVEGEEHAGFVIFEFDSKEDFDTAHESPEWDATAADALENFVRSFTRYAVDVTTPIGA